MTNQICEAAYQRIADRAWEEHLKQLAKRPKYKRESWGLHLITEWTGSSELARMHGLCEETIRGRLNTAVREGLMQRKQAGKRRVFYRWKG